MVQRTIDLCKKFLLEYFSDGKTHSLTEMEREFLGTNRTNYFYRAPIAFHYAFTQLIDDGKLIMWEDTQTWYRKGGLNSEGSEDVSSASGNQI